MILKHFLMGFGGVATITGVGIGVYYGTNSSEEIKNEANALKVFVPIETKSDKEDTQDNLESKDGSKKSNTLNK